MLSGSEVIELTHSAAKAIRGQDDQKYGFPDTLTNANARPGKEQSLALLSSFPPKQNETPQLPRICESPGSWK